MILNEKILTIVKKFLISQTLKIFLKTIDMIKFNPKNFETLNFDTNLETKKAVWVEVIIFPLFFFFVRYLDFSNIIF